MAKKSTIKGVGVYTISSADGHTRASFVPEKGGVGSSIIMPHGDKEREILFLHDNFWDQVYFDLLGGLPLLFPICARLERMGKAGNYLYDSHIYNMPIHGVAAYTPWQVIASDKPDELTLELIETKNTLAMYPFTFKVRLIYKVTNGCLSCEQVYSNTNNKPMPYYAGFHPYFLTPPPGKGKDKVRLYFNPTRLLRYNDRLTDLDGEKKVFNTPVSITDPQINEQLTEVARDNNVNLKYPDNFNLFIKTRGEHDLNMFRYIQLYTMPNKPFFCVEPWMAFPNAMNSVAGVRWLAPGKSEKGYLTISCLNDKSE